MGKFDRYKGVHQYFTFASFLDPSGLPVLSDVMTHDDFNFLKSDILDLMVTRAKAQKEKSNSNNKQSTTVSKEPAQTPTLLNKKKGKQPCIMAKMFSGLNSHVTIDITIQDDDKESIQ